MQLGDIQTLKNYCVSNNKWSSAFQLSIKYKLLDVPDLFAKHCVNVLGEYSLEKSVQINFEAGYYKHAAEHSFRVRQPIINNFLCFLFFYFNSSWLDWKAKSQ